MNKLPNGWSKTDDVSKIWRVGRVFSWSPVFNQWVIQNCMISIKPGETGETAYLREFSESLPKNDYVFWRDV